MFGETEKDEIVNEKFDRAVSGLADNLSDKTFLYRFLWIAVAVNAVTWLCVLFFHESVNQAYSRVFDISNKIGIAVLGFPLTFGFCLIYSLCRIKFPDLEENNLQSEMMASYGYQSHSLKRWYIWLFSILGGVLNVVLLFLVNLYLNDQL
ncbi:MAG TPA: hypothetical protein VF599_19295 [Pyrinomonadaceae bacterium]|jgi:hypothetical protein